MASLDLAKALNLPGLPLFLKQLNQRLAGVAETAGLGLKTPLLGAVNAKSKRLRPALLLASTIGSQPRQTTLSGATAIELLHIGSLVHDDIIDNPAVRWGRPTISSQNQATALLVGDYLLAQANAQAADISAEAARLISTATSGLIQGVAQENADQFKLTRSIDSYISCVGLKTGSLIAAACQLGGNCADLELSQSQALRTYGMNLGISFQIIDDLLDILSTAQLLGKPTGQDAANGTYSLPVLISLRGSSRTKLITTLASSSRPKALANLLIEDNSITQSISYANKYNQLGVDALSAFAPEEVSELAELPEIYLNWALNNLVAKQYQSKLNKNH